MLAEQNDQNKTKFFFYLSPLNIQPKPKTRRKKRRKNQLNASNWFTGIFHLFIYLYFCIGCLEITWAKQSRTGLNARPLMSRRVLLIANDDVNGRARAHVHMQNNHSSSNAIINRFNFCNILLIYQNQMFNRAHNRELTNQPNERTKKTEAIVHERKERRNEKEQNYQSCFITCLDNLRAQIDIPSENPCKMHKKSKIAFVQSSNVSNIYKKCDTPTATNGRNQTRLKWNIWCGVEGNSVLSEKKNANLHTYTHQYQRT